MLVIHLVVLLFSLFVYSKVDGVGRSALFFIVFYSLTPLFEFYSFDFFDVTLNYSYRADVLSIYAVTTFFLCAVIFLYFQKGSFAIADSERDIGFRVLWAVAFFAFFVDVYFNWGFFSLPKHEFILSRSEQTPNLFFITIPASELLVGALLFNPFKSFFFRALVFFVGVSCIAFSFYLGYRHLLMLVVVWLAIRKLNAFGFFFVCLVFSFLGELSSSLKNYIALLGRGDPVEMFYLVFGQVVFSGVSSEQKAILSNLIIKIDNFWMMDFFGFFSSFFYMFPFATSVSSFFGFKQASSSSVVSSFVGTLEGQGTAYSIFLLNFENFFFPMILFVFICYLLKVTRGSILFVPSLLVVFSFVRDEPSFWLGQIKMIVYMIIFVYLFNAFSRSILFSLRARQSPVIQWVESK